MGRPMVFSHVDLGVQLVLEENFRQGNVALVAGFPLGSAATVDVFHAAPLLGLTRAECGRVEKRSTVQATDANLQNFVAPESV